ncbi:MAG: DUF1638 domain-containing protein [bacterium]
MPRTAVIACEVFRDELEHLGVKGCRFLEQGLHRYPAELHVRLAAAVREAENECGRIILVYGLCGGGLEDISSASAELVFPRVHDCVHLFLGRRPESVCADGKGSFHLTRGWIRYGKNPYTEYLELRKRFGQELAHWSCAEMVKNYGRVVFIRTLSEDNPALEGEAEKFARCFGLVPEQTAGDLWLLEALLAGRPDPMVGRLPAGSGIRRDQFP